jgi:hypothetical protein
MDFLFLSGGEIMANLRSEVEQAIANEAKTLNLKRGYGKDLKQGKPIRDGGDIDVFPSQGDKVLYVDYMEGKQEKINLMIKNLENQFGEYATPDVTKSSYRLKLGNKKRNKTDIVNFRILKSGNRTPTAIQERGSNYILNLALGVKKGMKKYNFGDSAQNITGNTKVFNGLKEIFTSAYEERVKDWVHTYYQQQKEFLKKYEDSSWSEFIYGNNSFVKFFENHVKNIYITFGSSNPDRPAKKLQKYEQWNPSDIYAAYKMDVIKNELDEIIKGKENSKGVNLFRLNQYLIKLFNEERLVGISLKKINPPDNAKMILRNIDKESYMDDEVETEKYTLKDIKFDINGIHDRTKKTVSTYIKFGDGYQIDVKGSSSKFNNLAFGTLIKAKSAAQGGNAPINLVIRLMKKNGSNITFKNDNNEYPTNESELVSPKARMYGTKNYEKWFNELLKNRYFTTTDTYKEFYTYISSLYQEGDGAIAQSKLMQLHFYYDSLKSNTLGKDYWLKILYLGMKVGRIFAPHAKIY